MELLNRRLVWTGLKTKEFVHSKIGNFLHYIYQSVNGASLTCISTAFYKQEMSKLLHVFGESSFSIPAVAITEYWTIFDTRQQVFFSCWVLDSWDSATHIAWRNRNKLRWRNWIITNSDGLDQEIRSSIRCCMIHDDISRLLDWDSILASSVVHHHHAVPFCRILPLQYV